MGFGKRLDGIAGRRRATRKPTSLLASMFSVEQSRVVVLSDVSQSGARISAPDLPPEGQGIWLKAGPIDVFGTITWRTGEECGVSFERALSEDEAAFIEGEARRGAVSCEPADLRYALRNWRSNHRG
jgi:PilZ domain